MFVVYVWSQVSLKQDILILRVMTITEQYLLSQFDRLFQQQDPHNTGTLHADYLNCFLNDFFESMDMGMVKNFCKNIRRDMLPKGDKHSKEELLKSVRFLLSKMDEYLGNQQLPEGVSKEQAKEDRIYRWGYKQDQPEIKLPEDQRGQYQENILDEQKLQSGAFKPENGDCVLKKQEQPNSHEARFVNQQQLKLSFEEVFRHYDSNHSGLLYHQTILPFLNSLLSSLGIYHDSKYPEGMTTKSQLFQCCKSLLHCQGLLLRGQEADQGRCFLPHPCQQELRQIRQRKKVDRNKLMARNIGEDANKEAKKGEVNRSAGDEENQIHQKRGQQSGGQQEKMRWFGQVLTVVDSYQKSPIQKYIYERVEFMQRMKKVLTHEQLWYKSTPLLIRRFQTKLKFKDLLRLNHTNLRKEVKDAQDQVIKVRDELNSYQEVKCPKSSAQYSCNRIMQKINKALELLKVCQKGLSLERKNKMNKQLMHKQLMDQQLMDQQLMELWDENE